MQAVYKWTCKWYLIPFFISVHLPTVYDVYRDIQCMLELSFYLSIHCSDYIKGRVGVGSVAVRVAGTLDLLLLDVVTILLKGLM
jgi:hypothetical protein